MIHVNTDMDSSVSTTPAHGGGDEQVLYEALSQILYAPLSKRLVEDGEDGAMRQVFLGADAEFHARHPELKGQPLKASAPEELQDEWRLLYRRHSRMAMERLRLDADIVAGIA